MAKRIGIIVQCKDCNITDTLTCDLFECDSDKLTCECCGGKRLHLDVYLIEFISADKVDWNEKGEGKSG
jgi:hypothetical protein